MSEKERDYRLDLLRVIAISMIVLMHSPMPDSAPGFVLAPLYYFTASGIGLFFMISGALLLGNNLSTKSFLKRRFSKVLFPTLFWTFFYLGVKCINSSLQTKDLLTSVLSIPFSAQGHGVLWFMYTLSGLYLLTPILSRWLKSASKREVEFYLLLWGITLVYPYIKPFLTVNESYSGILYYFTGYVGYFLLGYYLKYHYQYKKFHVLIAGAIAVLVPTVLYSSHLDFDFTMLWYLSIPVALMSFVWYVLIGRSPNKRCVFLGQFSKLSFGIYLVHIFVMRSILWKTDAILALPGLIQIPVIAILTLLISFIVIWMLSKLPLLAYSVFKVSRISYECR